VKLIRILLSSLNLPPVTTRVTLGQSDTLATSSSVTLAAIKMADNQIPEITDFWMKSNVSEANRQAYHDLGWLTGNLISSVPEVDVPTTHD
jgi:hypothetical protein